MSEQPLDGSRRALMQVVVGAISTALAFRNACKVVEGEVSRDGWCKAFALAD
jgi:hypothetical protein